MGSLIGDYVHAHIRGYNSYGISRPGDDSFSKKPEAYNYDAARKRFIEKFTNKRTGAKMTDPQILEAEAGIARVFSGADPKSQDIAMQAIVSMIESNFNTNCDIKGFQQLSKMTSSGNIETTLQRYGQTVEIQRKAISQRIKEDDGAAKVRFSTMERQYNQVFNAIKAQIAVSEGTTKLGLQELKRAATTAYRQLKKECQYTIKSKGVSEVHYHMIDKTNESLKTIMTITNIIGCVPDSNNLGIILEHGIIAAGLHGCGMALQDIGKSIKTLAKSNKQPVSITAHNGVTFTYSGNAAEERTFNLEQFPAWVNINEVVGKGRVTLKANGKQKVDLTVTLPDSTSYSFSAKNAKLSSGKGVTVGTYESLLYILQKIEDPVFVNHWLNVSSQHKATEKRLGKFEGASTLRANIYSNAHNAMKSVLTILSLAGFDKEVDYLFVNNNTRTLTTGNIPIKIIPVDTIIDAISKQDLKTMSSIVSVNANGVSLANDSKNLWNNTWVGDEPDEGSARERINVLLNELHKTKMVASLRPVALLRIMGNTIDSTAYYKAIK